MEPARPRAGNNDCQKHVQRFSLAGPQVDRLYRSRETEETSSARRFAPADISIQVYSQGNLVAEGSGLPATMRHTVEQGATALMWSVRMIGVALAF